MRGTCIAERVGRVQTRDGSDRFPFQDSFTHHAYACETFRALRVARGHSFQRFSVTKDMVALTPMFRRGGGGEFYQFEAWDAEAYRLDRPEDVRSFRRGGHDFAGCYKNGSKRSQLTRLQPTRKAVHLNMHIAWHIDDRPDIDNDMFWPNWVRLLINND